MYDPAKFQQPRTALQPGRNLPNYASTMVDGFVRQEMAAYFGMVKCIDDNVGRLLDTLRTAGVLEKTFIVFTSDHGDMCGEHGRYNKGIPLEASARVPFLLYAPGVVKPGTAVEPALANVNFKPTILALMGFASPDPVEGRDASALFRGEAAGWKDIAFLRIGGPGDRTGERGWLGAFTRRYKLAIDVAGAPALFDLQTDPDELNNVFTAPEHREIVRMLGRELQTYASAHRDPLGNFPAVQRVLAWATDGKEVFIPGGSTETKTVPAKKQRKKKKSG
jgi:uncharacterized sulfatase